METNPLVGAWRLVAWRNRDADGRVTYPMGPDATGYIVYTADGHMAVDLMRAGRAPFAAGDLLRAEPAERQAAAESFVGYAGRYRFLGDRVIHEVEVSLFPNWVGTSQERLVTLEGNRLTLSTAPMVQAGRPQTAEIVWERA